MIVERQKSQMELAFMTEGRGEAPNFTEGTEAFAAKLAIEGPEPTDRLMEEVCERENLRKALQRVKSNQGSPGIDGMTVEKLPEYLKGHWPAIRDRLFGGTYQPKPVKRVEIEKPEGGMRKLGIPTVVDRFIQQALLQVLQGRWDRTFSEASFGFRPKRSAHQAVACAQGYIAQGYRWVVDIDLEKFFDRVNHDILMGRVAKRVTDKRVLRLIRAFLNAGVMEGGLVGPTEEGTPQGGPLSPLLSNLVLDDLDRELAKRGHRFVRYADDCNIYVRSERAGFRVMESVRVFLTKKLKLRINEVKSAVARASERKFLGFGFTNQKTPKRRIAPEAIARFKRRVRELTGRARGVSVQRIVKELAPYLIGWHNFFGHCESSGVFVRLDSWIRWRLRAAVWHQWRGGWKRVEELMKRGVVSTMARKTAASRRGPWRLARSRGVCIALPGVYFDSLGLPKLAGRMVP